MRLLGHRARSKGAQLYGSGTKNKWANIPSVVLKIDTVVIELKDQDGPTDASDILKLGEIANIRQYAVKSLRKAYGGMQTELVGLPTDSARNLLNKNSVGWLAVWG